MPTYDYRCPNGHDFEHFFRKISDALGELACPVCGATAERRMSRGAGLVFKGSGFYLTDYGKNAHRTSGPSSPSSESKSESKGDSNAPASSDGAKADGGSTTTSKSTSDSGGGDGGGGGSKTDSAKSADTKSSSKPKGNDTK